jgi:hypothetical protein
MGFKMIKSLDNGQNVFRAHLVNNELTNCGGTQPNPNCKILHNNHPGNIPYMTIGAAVNRGNGAMVTRLFDVSQKHKIQFAAKLWAYDPFELDFFYR